MLRNLKESKKNLKEGEMAPLLNGRKQIFLKRHLLDRKRHPMTERSAFSVKKELGIVTIYILSALCRLASLFGLLLRSLEMSSCKPSYQQQLVQMTPMLLILSIIANAIPTMWEMYFAMQTVIQLINQM